MSDEPILAEQRALTPKTEGEIDFRSHKIKTATMAIGQGYVVLRSLCEAFGLDRSAQQRRLSRTAIFREHSLICYIKTSQGKVPQTCLSAFAVPAFLMGVETSRIADEETRKLLEAFQEEGMIVLAEHFGLSERGEIRFLRESVSRMVVEQESFEEMVIKDVEKELAADRQARDEKIQQIREAFSKMRDQIRTLEKTAGPKARITPEQLGKLRHIVMVLGEMMIRAGGSIRPWVGIYTDITMQFGFAHSEDITQEAYPEVIEFLERQVQAFREHLLKPGETGPENEDGQR